MTSILIVDDEKDIVDALKIYLSNSDYRLYEAYTGKDAIEIFRNNEIDLILMDIMMPVMDGIAATKAIRAMDRADAKTIPIIAMTANAFEEDAKRCLAAGMTAHLAKPFQIEDVEKTIVECCGK